jgi:hypothetical protein
MTLESQRTLAVAAAVGALSGTHTAIWGMYKDAIHEGFAMRRFARSVCVGASAAVAIQAVLRLALPQAPAMVLLFGLAYGTERGIVEVWKTFIRHEDQSKYTIPMQFSVHGVPVADQRIRIAAALAYVAIITICLLAISRLPEPGDDGFRSVITTCVVGLVMGGTTAFGGAWKDAPTEGFDRRKFFRSPLMTVAFALLLAQMTDSYLQVAVAAIGYERAGVETYKTFFFPRKPRGKFAGKPIRFPDMLRHRRFLVPIFVAIWCWMLAAGAVALGIGNVSSRCAKTDVAERCP